MAVGSTVVELVVACAARAVIVDRSGKEPMQKLTDEQAVVISAYTGVLCCEFEVMHAEIEKRLGRPVWTHELGDERFMEDRIRPAFKDDFLDMCPECKIDVVP